MKWAAIFLATAAWAGEPPVFVRHPLPTAVPAGHTTVLTVEASPATGIEWQWMKDDRPLAGTNSPHLALTNATAATTGEYRAILRHADGERWSEAAAVIVQPPVAAAGHVDETFRDGAVYALALDAEGRTLAAGDFVRPATRLARWRAAGGFDAGYRAAAAGPNGAVFALAAVDDGLWVGGAFTYFDGSPAAGLVKLTATGERAALTPALPPNVEDVRVVSAGPDGRVWVAGRSRVGAAVTDWVVRLRPDSTRDPGFASPAFLNGRVRALAPLPDGRLWLAGNFFRPVGSSAHFNRLARVRPDGSADPTFTPPGGNESGANLEIRCLHRQADGAVLIGGLFNRVNGVSRLGLARVQADGSLDAAFAPPTPDDAPLALTQDAAGQIYVAGNISSWGASPVRSVARLLHDGSLDPEWQPPMFDGPAATLRVTPTGRLLAGGAFSSPQRQVVRLGTAVRTLPPPDPIASLPLPQPAALFQRRQWLAAFAGPGSVSDHGAADFPVTIAATELIDEARVWLDLRHADAATLTITLHPPPALSLPPITLVDGAALRHGADFRRTMFADQSLRPIGHSGAPYTATHAPSQPFSPLAGQPAAGPWTLRVQDPRADGRAVTALRWTLELFTRAAPPDFATWRQWFGGAAASGNADHFRSFAFAARPGHEPEVIWNPMTRQLSHAAWAADPVTAFRYWQSYDLRTWREIAPRSVRRDVRASAISRLSMTLFDDPSPPHAWWRIEALRSVMPQE